jgi:hypothetical protein
MKLIKRLIVVAAVLILLIVGGVVFAFFKLDSLVKLGIEQGGTQAMGVTTKVDRVSVGLLSGKASLRGLSIANPAGFKQPEFFALTDGSLSVTPASLNSNVVEIPAIKLSGITMSLERTSKGTNYGVILDNLQKLSGGGNANKSSGGKQVVVREIELTNIRVIADLIGAPGELTKIEVPIDSIKLTDVGSGSDPKRMEVANVAATVVQAILQAVAERGVGLPPDFVGDLKNRLSLLPQLGGGAFKFDAAVGQIKDLSGTVGEVGKKVEETTKQVTDEAKKAADGVKKIGDDLKNLIPGKKKDGG